MANDADRRRLAAGNFRRDKVIRHERGVTEHADRIVVHYRESVFVFVPRVVLIPENSQSYLWAILLGKTKILTEDCAHVTIPIWQAAS
jgi:hypothetical protein